MMARAVLSALLAVLVVACASEQPAAKPWNYASGGGAYGGGDPVGADASEDAAAVAADGTPRAGGDTAATVADADAAVTDAGGGAVADGQDGAALDDGAVQGVDGSRLADVEQGADALAGGDGVASADGGGIADGAAVADGTVIASDASADAVVVAICGNGLCEGGEGPQTCGQDCKLLTPLTSCLAQACAAPLQACLATAACSKAVDCMTLCGANATCASACLSEKSVAALPQAGSLSTCGVANGCLPAPVVCGNGKCETGETAASCAGDCAPPPPATVCGDGKCQAPETAASCPQDCAPPPAVVCGDGKCEAPETAASCAKDCAPNAVAVCGNGKCETGETSVTCVKDCPAKSAAEVAACVLTKCGAEWAACDKDTGCKNGLICLYGCNGGVSCATGCILAMPPASQQLGAAILTCGSKNSCF